MEKIVSKIQNKNSDSTIIESVESKIESVKARMRLENELGFILIESNLGIEFYGRESSAGTVYGSKIVKTPDQVFEWIKHEIPKGGKKPFGEKEGLKLIGRNWPKH
jgi:ABC-type enterochelin transport system substrate-binding protein